MKFVIQPLTTKQFQGLYGLYCLMLFAFFPIWFPIYLIVKAVRKKREKKAWEQYCRDYAVWEQQMYEWEQQQLAMEAWELQCEKDTEYDSVLEFSKVADGVELAVMAYTREPDLKAVVKIVDDEYGLSEKSWKRSVYWKTKQNEITLERTRHAIIRMNGKEYKLYNAPKA